MKKRLLLLLLSLCLLSGLFGCTNDQLPAQTTVASTPEAPPDAVRITEGDKALHILILASDAPTSAKRSAKRLGDALGVEYEVSSTPTEGVPQISFEICSAPGEGSHPMDYSISVHEGSIRLVANHAASLSAAVDYFLSRLSTDDIGRSYVGDEYDYSYMETHETPYGIVGYDFLYGESGFAGGDIVFYPETVGSYSFYWADENGVLADYSFLISKYAFGKELVEIPVQSFTAIPAGATRLVAKKGVNFAYSFELPRERIYSGEQLYSVGAISDSHQGTRYGETSLPYNHFVGAAKQLSDMGVSMIGICGDISYENKEFEYALHADAIREIYAYNPQMPIYTVSGNHECKYTGFSREWFLKYSRNVVKYDTKLLPVFSDGNTLDFVIELPDGSVMIYLNQIYYDYGKTTSRLLDDTQLDWLGARLEEYRDKTVFLFFHTFLDEEAGDASTSAGKEYSLPLIAGTVDHTRLVKYLTKYRNVVYFSGHSHQSFDLQFMKEKAGDKSNLYTNIDDNGGNFATMVHIPSVAAPRTGEKLSDDKTRSEGYVVYVYEDRVVLHGYDFVNQQTLAYACYVIMK